MKESPELSVSELLAWQAAYDSNDAYDRLQEAQVKQVLYHDLGAISLEGVTVTIDEGAVEAAEKEFEAARNDFDLLKDMANVVAMREDSPFAPLQSGESAPTPGVKPAERPGGPLPSVQERADSVLIYLLNNEGQVSTEDPAGVGGIIIEATGMTRDTWAPARQRLVEQGLIVLEKKVPEARRFTAIAVNEAKLSELDKSDALSEGVRKALEGFRVNQMDDEHQAGEKESESGGKPSFLDDRGGEKPEPEDDAGNEIVADNEDDTQDHLDPSPPDKKSFSKDLEAMHGRHQPKRRSQEQRISDADGKQFPLKVSAEGSTFSRTITVKQLRSLPIETRVLLGVGQANSPSFSFLDTEEKRLEFALKIVNKGVSEESATDISTMEEMIQDAIDKGYLHQNGNGPDLTAYGIEFIGSTKFGKSTLGQQSGAWKRGEAGDGETDQPAMSKSGGSNLSTARYVA